MSRSTNYSFTCACGQVHSSPIYEYVNVAQDPQLQYTLLAGLLNVATCPFCGRKAAIAQPFIYSDPQHHLLAYVHPSSNVPEEARQLILEKLRNVYLTADEEIRENGITQFNTATRTPEERELPPLKLVFGLEQFNTLLNTHLSQDERLGKLALSTYSHNDAERGQMLDIARKLASEMNCQIEVEDLPDEYTVWLYGSRRQIGALMRELAPRG